MPEGACRQKSLLPTEGAVCGMAAGLTSCQNAGLLMLREADERRDRFAWDHEQSVRKRDAAGLRHLQERGEILLQIQRNVSVAR
mgnify:CR=1 FL=1